MSSENKILLFYFIYLFVFPKKKAKSVDNASILIFIIFQIYKKLA